MQTEKSEDKPKIVHKSLEERTRDYWKVSRIWNGRGGMMQVGQALSTTYNIMMTSNPHSKLAEQTAKLEHEIIQKQQ